eukprot:scaffold242967_cov13-Prasinocladus_malaysianus.AAC.1
MRLLGCKQYTVPLRTVSGMIQARRNVSCRDNKNEVVLLCFNRWSGLDGKTYLSNFYHLSMYSEKE